MPEKTEKISLYALKRKIEGIRDCMSCKKGGFKGAFQYTGERTNEEWVERIIVELDYVKNEMNGLIYDVERLTRAHYNIISSGID